MATFIRPPLFSQPPPSESAGKERFSTTQKAAFGLTAAVGAVASAVGTYHQAEARKYQLRSEALNLEFAGTQADLDARAAERAAQFALERGRQTKALTTLRFRQMKSSFRTRTASSGVQVGVGSAAEVEASVAAAKEMEVLTIERNSVREASAARLRRVEAQNRASLSRVSAQNLRETERAISPTALAVAGGTGQLGSSLLSLSAGGAF